jgi:hypothetical protein
MFDELPVPQGPYPTVEYCSIQVIRQYVIMPLLINPKAGMCLQQI